MVKDNYGSTEDSEAKFNLGLALLERVNKLFYVFNDAVVSGKYGLAKEILDLAYDEVDFGCKDTQKQEQIDLENQLIKILLKVPIDQVYLGRYVHQKERAIFRNLLREYAKLVRKFMKESGMLMPQKGEEGMF